MKTTLVLVALLAAAVVFAAYQTVPRGDGLVPVTSFDYVNDYPDYGIKVVCSHRGNRADFKEDGSDITAGDRVVRDCRVTAR